MTLAAVSTATIAHAQGSSTESACLSAIPDSSLRRVPVYASIDFASVGRTLPQSAAQLLQAIGHHARREIGAAPGELPNADSAFTWRDLDGGLALWSHRDGRVTWTVVNPDERWARSGAGVALLDRALGTARDSGQAVMIAPDTIKADSIALVVSFIRPRIDPSGVMHPAEAAMALPIFMVPVPRETEVSVARPSRKRFPDSLLRQGVTGTVILDFAVDTNGVADTTTIKDASPDIRDALPRKMRAYYNQFVATARGMIADTRYVPATINGCRVRQTVRQPFSWVISA